MWDDTVSVLNYPTVTERGVTRPDLTATPTEVAVTGVDVQPGVSVELADADRREGTSIRWTVFLSDVPVLSDKSIVRWQGRVYQVDGEPATWGGDLAYRVAFLVDWK